VLTALKANKMKIKKSKKGVMWREVVLWVIVLGVLIILLVINSSLKQKMVSDLQNLFKFLRMG
jgi:type VI protein secretion system component VasF